MASNYIEHPNESLVDVYRKQLKEKLNPQALCPHLMMLKFVDQGTYRKIGSRERLDGSPAATDVLLNHLQTKNKPGWHDALLDALWIEKYPYLYHLLMGHITVTTEDQKHYNAMLASLPQITKKIQPDQLLPFLLGSGCISAEDSDQVLACQTQEGPQHAALKLVVAKVPSRQKGWFDMFCEALFQTKHYDLEKLLRESVEVESLTSGIADMAVGDERRFELRTGAEGGPPELYTAPDNPSGQNNIVKSKIGREKGSAEISYQKSKKLTASLPTKETKQKACNAEASNQKSKRLTASLPTKKTKQKACNVSDEEIKVVLEQYLTESRYADSTKKNHRGSLEKYLKFCKTHKLNPVPLSEENALVYLSEIAGQVHHDTYVRNWKIVKTIHDLLKIQQPYMESSEFKCKREEMEKK